MTETLSERLRAAALLDAHFAVPAERDELVLLLHDAAEDLDAICQRAETALVAGPQPSARAAVDAWMDVFVARSQYFEDTLTKANDKIRDLKRDCIDAGLALQGMRQDNETLRKMLVHAGEHATAVFAEWRAFLERAVCHPGPPLSETEGYDPDAPVGELEAAVLERMDLELKAERELWDIRKLCEEARGRTPDPARSTMQVVRDVLAMEAPKERVNREAALARLTVALDAMPGNAFLCPEDRFSELMAAAHDAATALRVPLWIERRMANVINDFATYPGRDEEGRLNPIVRREHFAGPFPAISGYVKRTQEARAATIDQALRMLKDGQRLAVHDEPERVDILFLDPGQEPPLGQEWTVYGPPHPKAAEFQKLVDDLRGKHAGALNSPETRARLQTEIAGFMAAQRDAPAPPNIDLDDERSDLPDGKIAFKVRVSPELAAAIERQLDEEAADRMRRAMTYRPGSPIPERAPADYHPAEYMTPEQEAACEEQRDRFDHDED